jgi:hypothetical protein
MTNPGARCEQYRTVVIWDFGSIPFVALVFGKVAIKTWRLHLFDCLFGMYPR